MKSSRRQFLQTSLSAPLAVRLGRLARLELVNPRASTPAQGQEQFAMPHFVRYDAHCFTVNDRDRFIFSASFHYPRCPRSLWSDRLEKLQLAGFNTIEAYAFWNYHEPEEGRVDLGEFEDFIKLVGDMGFWMIVRPGPYVCAEWDAGGFPHWVIARRFPLRSNHPQSIQTSQHWYSEVLPVIRRHLITHGGPIILMQIENEYDYWQGVSDADKRAYVSALAHMAWEAGIDVPLITCWTKQVRERSYPDMARLADFCNFYPRWNILKEVVPGLQKLRAEEPASPVGVVELQGGWFSEFGGKLSVDQEGVNAAQLNMLSKTAVEQGATFFNYYMGFGGTNFDWAAKNLTTTYDYAAPVREPGGLWEKYYAARGIGSSLRILGDVLTRAEMMTGALRSTNPSVSVSERSSGKSGVVFIRENANAEQQCKISLPDPNSPTHRIITAPREGQLTLGAREMKMLPVQVPITGGRLRYTTAEVLAHGDCGRPFLIIYDDPGRLVELSLAAEEEPHVEGETVYQYWDSDYESVVIGLRVEKADKMLLFNGHLQIIVLPRDLALRTWTARFSPTMIPGGEQGPPLSVPFITDCALMRKGGSSKSRGWAELEFAPGQHNLAVLLPPLPSKCAVNDAPAEFHYDRHWQTARLRVEAPALPYQPITLTEVRTWAEKFNLNSGEWRDTFQPLEELGSMPYGYVKYRAELPRGSESTIVISAFADDAKKVFVNGRLVPEASAAKKRVEFPLSRYAQSGANTLEIAYEAFGSPNFGDNLGELKGLESISLGGGSSAGEGTRLRTQVQRFPAAMRGRDIDPEFSIGRWTSATLGGGGNASKEVVPAFTWCRAEFRLEKPQERWSVPWKATFKAERDALLYLNGKFVGRYVTAGPQTDFYLPEPYLVFERKGKNVLTVVLAYTEDASAIRALRIAPYEEFSTYRSRVEFEW